MPHVARVVVDSPLPHLDRPFDYDIPEPLRQAVGIGTRVRVPFAGRLISAVVTELPDHAGVEKLAAIRSAAAMPSFTPDGIRLAREVAARYGGSLWDVLRLMAPPRVAAVEKREWTAPQATAQDASYRDALEALRRRLADETRDGFPAGQLLSGQLLPSAGIEPVRLVWPSPPDARHRSIPAEEILIPALMAASAGRTGIVVVPDARALACMVAALTEAGLSRWARGRGEFAVLDHDDGASARYGSYLAAMRGDVRVVLGTRPVALQPVPRLGSIAVWDEGSDALQEAHAPYPHARTIAAMRSQTEGCDLLLAGFAPSVDAAALVAHGFSRPVESDRASIRAWIPDLEVLDTERREREGGAGRHWMPPSAWRKVLKASRASVAGIVVPRAGYVTATACAACGTWAGCRDCGGELGRASRAAAPTCRDCGVEHHNWHCQECNAETLRSVRQGVDVVAEQVRRMAAGTPVTVSSAAGGVLADDAVREGIVVATPGAVPAVEGGYAHIAVVGAHVPAAGGLGAEVEAVRWWLNVAALARGRAAGGGVTLVGELPEATRRAIVAWDPWGAAVAAYAERAELGLPPARRAIILEGSDRAVEAALSARVNSMELAHLPGVTVGGSPQRAVMLAPRGLAQGIVDALREVVVERSRTGNDALRIRVDAPLGP